MFKAVKYGMRKIKGAGLASVCFLGFAFFSYFADSNASVKYYEKENFINRMICLLQD